MLPVEIEFMIDNLDLLLQFQKIRDIKTFRKHPLHEVDAVIIDINRVKREIENDVCELIPDAIIAPLKQQLHER